jgi:fucose permease
MALLDLSSLQRQRHGTGVLPVFFAVMFMRGVTVGVVGTSSLFIAQSSGLPQNQLVAARGLGLIIGPALLGKLVGKFVWSGESQLGTASLLLAKAACEAAIPRATSLPVVLYLSFFVLGLAMTSLDVTKNVLVTRVFGDRCALPLNFYEVTYGLGAMLAPAVTVALRSQAWNVLVLVDLSLALLVATKRLRFGKPRGWKVKLRGVPTCFDDVEKCAQVAKEGVPRRVLAVGLTFLFVAQACETAMSAWGFTFAATTLGLPVETAAMFPTVFYIAFTGARFLSLWLSSHLPPSTILQVSTALVLAGSVSLHSLDAQAATVQALSTTSFLASVAMIGVGVCPLYATTLACIRRHGDLSSNELALYQTCSALGNTMGLWMPGLLGLPQAERLWACAIFLMLNSNRAAFPWWPKSEPTMKGDMKMATSDVSSEVSTSDASPTP